MSMRTSRWNRTVDIGRGDVLASEMIAVLDRIEGEHLVRLNGQVDDLPDSWVTLVFLRAGVAVWTTLDGATVRERWHAALTGEE